MKNLFVKILSLFIALQLFGVDAYATPPNNAKQSQYTQDLGMCSLLAFEPNFANLSSTNQQSAWQNWLLDCQLRAIRLGAYNKGNLISQACIKAVTPGLGTFSINRTTPYVLPNGVCQEWSIVEVRQGNSGTPLYNWNGDPTTRQLSRLQQPMYIMPPHSFSTGVVRIIGNSIGTDGGSGWVYGATWRAAQLAVGSSGGTGFVGAESCTVANPDAGGAGTATTPTFVCGHATAGVCDTLTYAPTQWQSTTGMYYLPPYLQRQQWAVTVYFFGSKAGTACSANGVNDCFDGHDTKHVQAFVTPLTYIGNSHTTTTIDGITSTTGLATGMYVAGAGIPANTTISTVNANSIVISNAVTSTVTGLTVYATDFSRPTTCGGAGTGLTVTMKFWPDWCSGAAADADTVSCATNTSGLNGTNAYDKIFGNYTASTGFINQIYEEQSRHNFDATAGYTWGGIAAATELTVNYVQTHLSHYGLVVLGSDVVINHHNDVGSAVQLKLRGGGSIHVMEARLDTPSDPLNSDGHAIEVDTCKNCAINNGTFFHNTNSAADVGTLSANYVRLGSDAASTSTTENADVTVRGQIYSDGSAGVNLTALGCAFTRSSIIDLNVSNIGTAGTARVQQFNKFAAYGSNCENSNRIGGSIDNQAGAITSGSFSGAQLIWQAALQAWVNAVTTMQNKVFQISGALAVANDLTNWMIMPAAGSWTKFYAVCKTGPTGAAAIFDVQKSTNNGSSFTSIWNSTPANKPTIADGQVAGNTSSMDTVTFAAGDVFRVDVDQVGSTIAGSNCTLMGVATY